MRRWHASPQALAALKTRFDAPRLFTAAQLERFEAQPNRAEILLPTAPQRQSDRTLTERLVTRIRAEYVADADATFAAELKWWPI